jgi:hypothetical protein
MSIKGHAGQENIKGFMPEDHINKMIYWKPNSHINSA